MPPTPSVPIYEPYIQKSAAFLFPLLELNGKSKDAFLPAQTYLALRGVYKPYDHKLICSYVQHENNPAWDQYQQQRLLTHRLLETSVAVPGQQRLLYIFNLSAFAADVELFLQGAYSRLSPGVSRLLCAYYGVESPEWAHIEGFLHPEVAIPRYARQLGYSVDDFRATLAPNRGELCPRYDQQLETISVELPADFVEQLVIV